MRIDTAAQNRLTENQLEVSADILSNPLRTHREPGEPLSRLRIESPSEVSIRNCLRDALSRRQRQDRCANSVLALIITTNLPFSEWTQVFTSARPCKALLDRMTDRAHLIETGTESYRLRRNMEGRKREGRRRDRWPVSVLRLSAARIGPQPEAG